MRNLLPLLGLLALAPLAASAQTTEQNMQRGGAEMVERQAAARARNSSPAPTYSTLQSGKERRASRQRAKARLEDRKKNGYLIPGGTRVMENGDWIGPNGELVIDGSKGLKNGKKPRKNPNFQKKSLKNL